MMSKSTWPVTKVELKTTKERCAHRAKKISWCNKHKRFCNAPDEYDTCSDYTSKTKQKATQMSRLFISKNVSFDVVKAKC